MARLSPLSSALSNYISCRPTLTDARLVLTMWEMKVRCVNNTGSRALSRLEIGKIYQVVRVDTTDMTYEIDDKTCRSWWSSSRFEVVDDNLSIAVPTASGATCQKCHTHNEYAPASSTFVCYGCRT